MKCTICGRVYVFGVIMTLQIDIKNSKIRSVFVIYFQTEHNLNETYQLTYNQN